MTDKNVSFDWRINIISIKEYPLAIRQANIYKVETNMFRITGRIMI